MTPTSTPQSVIGEPVSQVLERIKVRDPHHKPSGIYGRRMADYENHVPILLLTLAFALVVLVAGPFESTFLKSRATLKTAPPAPAPVAAVPKARESLSVPEAIHPHPQTVLASVKETPAALPGPENLHADFLGPRMIEFQWDAISPGYVYRLYGSQNQDFAHPILLSDHPLQAPFMAWTPDDGIEQLWVTVKGFDPQGRETGFSRPLRVQLPS